MEMFVLFLAVIVSAVLQIDLLWTAAVFEITYKLLCLMCLVYRSTVRRKRKKPIRSAKQDGRLRHKRN